MSFLSKLGAKLQNFRVKKFESQLEHEVKAERNSQKSKIEIVESAHMSKPSKVFLRGGNGLQNQNEAASNGGCGVIAVNEIKSGKSRYTNIDWFIFAILIFL